MNKRSTFTALLGAAVLIGGTTLATHAIAAPAAGPACQGSGLSSSVADVDGDAHSDIVVGVPVARTGGHFSAGVVDVHLAPENGGGTQRFDESLFGTTPGRFDNFGGAVSFLDANGDACSDLAIGAYRADDGRGRVTIALGSDGGVSAVGAITLTGQSADEEFGSTIVANGHDLWISAPDRAVDGVEGAGAVDHYRVADGVATLVQTLTENTPGVHGLAETNDNFGRELDVSTHGPLVVGEPAEDVGSHAADAGTVTLVYDNSDTGLLTKSSTYSQNSPGIPGTAEAGDHFGTSVTSSSVQFVVGVPGEALGNLKGAGTVDSFFLLDNSTTPQMATGLSQNSPGVPGGDEAYDRFGKQVVDVGGGMCIGVPGESIGHFQKSGEVLCVGRHEDDETRWDYLHQGTGALGGRPHPGAAFGTYLSTLPFPDLASGPDSDGHAGGEDLLTAVTGAHVARDVSAGQVRIESRVAVHDSAGPIAGEHYGVPAFVVSQGPFQDFD